MKDFSLDKQMNIEVKATFIAKGQDGPVSGKEFKLRLYDKDVFGEDYIGESDLNQAGEGRILFGHKAFNNPLATDILPDFYFVLYKNLVPVFQSKVIEDLNLQVIEHYRPGEGEVIDLGTYLVEA